MSYDLSFAVGSYASELHDEMRLDQLKKQKDNANREIKTVKTAINPNPDKVSRQSSAAATQLFPHQDVYKPIFTWKKNTDTANFEIIPNEKTVPFHQIYNTNSQTNHLLSLFGYKINVSQQVDQFKQRFQKFFIESKSHNPLIGKFSELKFGLMATLLSLLGVEPNTLEQLKKEALKKAIQNNILCFEQNEYNTELITIFTKTKKDTGRLKVLTEIRKQLIKQMANYGEGHYYTKDRIYSIKKEQVLRILGDLLEEQQNLSYIRNFQ